MKYFLTLLFVILSIQLPKCQQTVLDPPPPAVSWSNTSLANVMSYIPVAASLGYDTIKSYRSSDRKRSFIKQAEREGINIGAATLVKALIHRTRPDKSDNQSFFSEHTIIAASGASVSVTIPLAAGAGYLRMAANKHYLTDVITGLGVGLLTGRFVK